MFGAVLEQRNLAGVGNVYANELCFLRGVLPTTPIGETDAAAVVDLARRLLVANRGPIPAGDDRRHPPGTTQLGVRPHRPAVPALRHDAPRRRTRRSRGTGARRHLVPGLPTLTVDGHPAP